MQERSLPFGAYDPFFFITATPLAATEQNVAYAITDKLYKLFFLFIVTEESNSRRCTKPAKVKVVGGQKRSEVGQNVPKSGEMVKIS